MMFWAVVSGLAIAAAAVLAVKLYQAGQRVDHMVEDFKLQDVGDCLHLWRPAGPFLSQCVFCTATIESDCLESTS